MVEDYEMFLSKLGPQFAKAQPSPQQIAKFTGRLPSSFSNTGEFTSPPDSDVVSGHSDFSLKCFFSGQVASSLDFDDYKDKPQCKRAVKKNEHFKIGCDV